MEQKEPWKMKVDLFKKRFAGRTDVYSVFKTWTRNFRDENGNHQSEEGSGLFAKCKNYGDQNLCLIAKNMGKCTTCSNKVYEDVSDSAVWKHISGEYQMIVHLLSEKGIKFGALDFDYSFEKVPDDITDEIVRKKLAEELEDKNAEKAFADAKLARDFSLSLGIKCFIARSRKKGYHLYWFFNDWIDAKYFTSFTRFIAESVGFNERALHQGIPAPEIFPKQTIYKKDSIGNGIRVPMTEKQMRIGRNCWVDDQRQPIAFEKQWNYFESLEEVDTASFLKILEEKQIEIIEGNAVRTDSKPKEPRSGTAGVDSQYKIPKDGDFNNIVNNCPALKQFWEKDESGHYKWEKDNKKGVPHTVRLASLSMAIRTKNGVDIILERWNSDITKYQIEYALANDHKPHTCKTMQSEGVCMIGKHPKFQDHCLKKIPPKVVENGKVVENPDKLPESEWPDPSPVRFATEKRLSYETILQRLEELKATEPKPENMGEILFSLLKSAHYLTQKESESIKNWVKANRLIQARDLSKMSKRVTQDIKEESYKEKVKDVQRIEKKNVDYFCRDNKYWRSFVNSKGMRMEEEITNFTVEIREIFKTLDYDDDEDEGGIYNSKMPWCSGVIITQHGETNFNTVLDEIVGSADKLSAFINKTVNIAAHFDKKDSDDVMFCIKNFSQNNCKTRIRLEKFGHYKFKGDDFVYVTPSVLISKEGIKKNDEYEMRFSSDITRHLDMRAIDEDEFKNLALHIVNDYFECNSPSITMSAFAHAMAATIIVSHMPIHKSPLIWAHGNQSGGKSFIFHAAQCFFGNFPAVTSSASTGKSKMLLASFFRDALIVIDDFKKHLGNPQETVQFIQSAYDRSSRTAARRDGEIRDSSPKARGLVAYTAEDVPDSEASAISRMLLFEISGKKSMNVDKGAVVARRQKEYSGFTPHFIHYVYGLGKDEVEKLYREYINVFDSQSKQDFPEESTQRTSENLAVNMTAFRLAMDLLLSKGVIVEKKHQELCARHIKNLEICRQQIFNSVHAQRGSAMFLVGLSDLIQDQAHYKIDGWSGYETDESKNAKTIGFYNPKTPELVFISTAAHGDINRTLNMSKAHLQSKQHIARQLVAEGHIPAGMWDKSSDIYAKQLQFPGTRARMYCWVLKASSVGLDVGALTEGIVTDSGLKSQKSAVNNSEEGDPLWNLEAMKS